MHSAEVAQLSQATAGRLQAVFLDRDGTINRERADYVKSWQEYEWLPGALAALTALARFEVPIFVVTNQSALGRGILEAGALDAIHAHLRAEVEAVGGRIDGFLICPHAPQDRCACRKPQPGLLLEAARRYHLELGRCVFVGDTVTDMQAAMAAGCSSILVRTGRQGQQLDALLAGIETGGRQVTIVADLSAAVDLITSLSAHDLHCETSSE
jgi:D-glycero-D-manno-heptose 1,7-bisphosphate phosphatase